MKFVNTIFSFLGEKNTFIKVVLFVVVVRVDGQEACLAVLAHDRVCMTVQFVLVRLWHTLAERVLIYVEQILENRRLALRISHPDFN